MGDELLRRAPAASAVRHLPAQPCDTQLFGREMDALLCKHMVDDREILLLIGRMIVDDETESIRE